MWKGISLRKFYIGVVVLGVIITLVAINYIGQKVDVDVDSLVNSSSYGTRRQHMEMVNCKALIDGDKSEVERTKNVSNERHKVTDAEYLIMTTNCFRFTSSRYYITHPLTDTERDFPIAYSILMYTNVEQTERLLRAIYRPQNIYCIHVDKKTAAESFNAIKAIAKCFNNVLLTDQRFDVRWGEMTVLEPEITCMRQLWNSSVKWKYFINLTGQEFPLRTNYELVRILQAYKGANDVEAVRSSSASTRWHKAGPPPHNIVPIKGAVHVVLSRAFVNFLLHDQRSLDFLEWTRKTYIPDETYFASLNHNPHLGAPGSYKGDPTKDSINEKHYLARYKTWREGPNYRPCFGKWVRNICIFGSGDLPQLAVRKELFANKFFLDYQHTLNCMEELIFNKTRDYTLGDLKFNANWYGNMDFVKKRFNL